MQQLGKGCGVLGCYNFWSCCNEIIFMRMGIHIILIISNGQLQTILSEGLRQFVWVAERYN